MIQCQALEFQSTLSVRRATFVPMIPPTVTAQISIHALREESDPLKYIYPHLPYKFQSTLSVRRATGVTAFNFCLSLISIHALREESDFAFQNPLANRRQFQSTLSVRRATGIYILLNNTLKIFQSTLSVRRATFSSF